MNPARKTQLLCCGLAVLVFANFANTFGNAFTNWDDHGLIVDNPAIRIASFGDVVAIFTPTPGRTFQPLRVLSYALDYAIWGMQPLAFHLSNTLLHATAAILLFLWLRRWLPIAAPGRGRVALATAAIFAIHPLNVEAVTWMSSRKYGLLAAFWAYEHRDRGLRYCLFSGVALLGAVWSSPFGVVAPAALILSSFVRRDHGQTVRTSATTIALPCLAALPVLFALLSGGEANVAVKTEEPLGLLTTALSMTVTFGDYLRQIVIPLGFNCKYPRSPIAAPTVAVALVLAAATAAAWLAIRRWHQADRLPAWGIAWFVLWLLPVSNIIPISTFRADRYMYLAMIGPVLLLVLVGEAALRSRPRLLATSTLLVLAILSGLTFSRNRDWRDSEALWRASLQQDNHNPIAHNSLASALNDQGQHEEAYRHFRTALDQNGSFIDAALNLAIHHQNRGQWQEADPFLAHALKINRNHPRVLNSLALQLRHQDDPAGAIRALEIALSEEPELGAAWSNLGNLHRENDNMTEAVRCWQQGADAGESGAHYELGRHFGRAGDLTRSDHHLREAIRLRPEFAEAWYNLGVLLARQSRFPDALTAFQQAGSLRPDYLEAQQAIRRLEGTTP